MTVFDTLVFDVMGTLLDEGPAFHRAARTALPDRPDEEVDAFLTLWSQRMDAAMRDVQEGQAPFATVDVLQRQAAAEAASALGVDLTPDALTELSRVGHRFPPFPDTVAAFERLARDHVMVGLTNAGLSQAMDMSAFGGLRWTTLVSAETVGAYKPDPRMYAYVVARLDVDPRRSLFVAAHPWDLDAAGHHGFATAYIDRDESTSQTLRGFATTYDIVVPDLAALADTLESSVETTA